MAKTPASKAAPDKVKVRLKCYYSGFPGDPGPGSEIEVEQAEAERLIDLGAAEHPAE